MFCCCCVEDTKADTPKTERPKTTSKLIIDSIIKFPDYNTMTFNVIIYSFDGKCFYNLCGSGFLICQLLLNSTFPKLRLIRKAILFRIFCITTCEMLYTNHEAVIGTIEKLDANYLLSL